MKLEFRGWQREVTVHEHQLSPVTEKDDGSFTAGKPGESVDWISPLEAYAKISDTALTGAFLVKISFEAEELRNWLLAFASVEPEEAIRYLAEAQAEAVIALTQMTHRRLAEKIQKNIEDIREQLEGE